MSSEPSIDAYLAGLTRRSDGAAGVDADFVAAVREFLGATRSYLESL